MIRTMLVALCILCAASACSHGGSSSSTLPSGAPAPRATRYEKGFPYPLFARAKSSKDIDPNTWYGEEAFITDHGLVPNTLVAKVGALVLFINETKRTERIRFLNGTWTSSSIRPGKSVGYRPSASLTYKYEVVDHQNEQATLYVETYYEPGDTPTPSPGAG